MKPLLIIPALLASFCLSAQQYHVTLRPHFNGEESSPIWNDSSCSGQMNQEFPSYGFQDFLAIAWTSGGCQYKVRHLIRFADLSNPAVIPTGSHIVSAILHLYGEAPNTGDGNYGNSCYPGSPYNDLNANTYLDTTSNAAWLYEVTDSFDAQTVTWNTQPDIKHTDSVAMPYSTSQWGGLTSINITSLVADEVMNGNTGFKMVLKDENLYRELQYASSFYADSTYHPSLDIIYTPPLGVNDVNDIYADVQLYPNPATTQLNMQLALTAGADIAIKVYNETGTLMDAKAMAAKKGINYYSVTTANWPGGVYLLVLSDGVSTMERKFVKN